MSKLKKVFKVLIVIVVSIVVLSSPWWFWPERTPAIKSQNSNSIASIDYIEIGGVVSPLKSIFVVEIVYFDNSAHFPFFEEPGKFCREVKRILLTENHHPICHYSYNLPLAQIGCKECAFNFVNYLP